MANSNNILIFRRSTRAQLRSKDKRLTVSVLVNNAAAVAFWRAVGYRDYCLTMEILPDATPTQKRA